MIEFFMPMSPPTTTAQQHRVAQGKGGRKVFYDSPELASARAKLEAHLGQHVPEQPMNGALMLMTKWIFPITGKHQDGEWRITRPDTDNLTKMLKDCMTRLRYWRDDALVAVECIEKRWGRIPGIYVRIEELP